jgi:putative peptidoglycan lipid II flippase
MKKTIQKLKRTLNARPVLFLAAAALLHISVAAAVFTVGKYQLMPAQFRANGLGEFASDGFFYQDEAVYLVTVLKSHDLAAWATWPTQLHVRLYSLPLACVSHWMGFNVLAIEPLNLLYYLAMLALVFRLGKEIFDYRAGLIGAAIVAVWPSLLLHTTQLVRDPLLIAAVLGLLLVITRGLKRDYSWHRGALMGLLAALALVVIRIVRLPMWDLTCAIVWFGALLLLVRMLRERRILIGNVGLAVIMIAAVFVTPHFQTAFRNQQNAKARRKVLPEQVQALPFDEQIAKRRKAFGLEAGDPDRPPGPGPGSVIDADVTFNGRADIIRYLPRAAVIGFFAPFPNMWLTSGTEVGRSGRVLSGLETLFTYVIECFALAGLWHARRQLAAWLLVFAAGVGVLALGLVVDNVGALYRLRYSFWILIVVLGAGGVTNLFRQKSSGAFSPDSQPE